MRHAPDFVPGLPHVVAHSRRYCEALESELRDSARAHWGRVRAWLRRVAQLRAVFRAAHSAAAAKAGAHSSAPWDLVEPWAKSGVFVAGSRFRRTNKPNTTELERVCGSGSHQKQTQKQKHLISLEIEQSGLSGAGKQEQFRLRVSAQPPAGLGSALRTNKQNKGGGTRAAAQLRVCVLCRG